MWKQKLEILTMLLEDLSIEEYHEKSRYSLLLKDVFTRLDAYDSKFIEDCSKAYWKNVDLIIERRENTVRHAYARYQRVVGICCRRTLPDSMLVRALERCRSKKVFNRIFKDSVTSWKTERIRSLGSAARSLRGNQRALLREVDKLYLHYDYRSIQWLWTDIYKLDILSLEGRTVEDICFDN